MSEKKETIVSHTLNQDPKEVEEYWTKERMQSAQPINMTIDESQTTPQFATHTVSQDPKEVEEYWTKERMQKAKPMSMIRKKK